MKRSFGLLVVLCVVLATIQGAFAGAGTEVVQSNGKASVSASNARQFEDVRMREPIYQYDDSSPKFEITGISCDQLVVQPGSDVTISIGGIVGSYDPVKIAIKSVTLDSKNRFIITFEKKGDFPGVRAQILDFNSPRFLEIVKARMALTYLNTDWNKVNIHVVNDVDSLNFDERPYRQVVDLNARYRHTGKH